jgi:hypothetical protein
VNRVWSHYFGQGIVRTPNNFGLLGERPTHPELLDWLASWFVKQGWSLKKLHKLILLSATYQQSATASAETLAKDPDNRLLGRMNRKRLEAEAIRDSLLAASGRLNVTMGGVGEKDFSTPRRTLYIMSVRSERTGFCPLFDGADPTSIVEKRTVSTVAPQALYLLNSDFMTEQAKALQERMERETPKETDGRIVWLYRLLFGREPKAEEAQVGRAFLKAESKEAWRDYAHLLLCTNEFITLD